MEVELLKVQTTLKGEAAEKFLASMARNHRTIAGEAAYRLERSLEAECAPDASTQNK